MADIDVRTTGIDSQIREFIVFLNRVDTFIALH
jgi:hypothetical protein